MEIREIGYGKINLGLDVLGMRADRYHEVAMVMQSITLCDTVHISPAASLIVTTDRDGLEGGPSNLAYKAAVLLGEFAGREPRVHIHIEKRIFLAAGLAGGSTDAAAVLRGLTRYWSLDLPADRLGRLGAQLGSDVPFCVTGGTALATGRGEVLSLLPDLPRLQLVLGKPPVGVSTPWAYREFDRQKNVVHPDMEGMAKAAKRGDVQGVLERCGNVLESVTARVHPEIREIKELMRANGAAPVLMSGSGPTVFGVVRDNRTAAKIAGLLKSEGMEAAVTETAGRIKL